MLQADTANHAVRQIIMATLETTTLAGQGPNGAGYKDDTGTNARFHTPGGCAVDGTGTFALIVRSRLLGSCAYLPC